MIFIFSVTEENIKLKTNIPDSMLNRLKLQDKTIIKFEELYAAVRDPATSGAPAWFDPVSHRHMDRPTMTASQVHVQLKEKVKQRYKQYSFTSRKDHCVHLA